MTMNTAIEAALTANEVTADGRPLVRAVEWRLDRKVTAAERDAAWEEYQKTRDNPPPGPGEAAAPEAVASPAPSETAGPSDEIAAPLVDEVADSPPPDEVDDLPSAEEVRRAEPSARVVYLGPTIYGPVVRQGEEFEEDDLPEQLQALIESDETLGGLVAPVEEAEAARVELQIPKSDLAGAYREAVRLLGR